MDETQFRLQFCETNMDAKKGKKKNTYLPTKSSNDEMMMTQKSEKDKNTEGGC